MLLHVSIVHYFFLLLNSSPLYRHKHFFIHSPIDGYLNYFQLVAITDKSAINIGVQLQVFVWLYASISLGEYLEVEWSDGYGMCIFSF